ncbi:hypothetical protein I2494_16960 [Budviciaceae bacterium BWR-B9]|uniref:Uncharacterized protein n=1 Tax=Limnobaculum allomyrinae TaxID=2791986 RepID=A0ABS1IUF5_9GAMM|nr:MULTISPECIES: hypothetical protein [Limnobaculum]MBK5145380.1 hypothetical protein [Limnobaculum allomyrinae]MBV7693192.1 hypothetical protein [Limnobaculum sp. M2-1]
MKLNKKFLVILSIALLIIFYFSRLAPTIYLHNNTNNDLYIYTMQHTGSMEPTLEELQQLKRINVIRPNEQLSLPVSISYFEDSELFSKWKIGSQSGNGGSIMAYINDSKGVCALEVFIKENSIEVTDKKAIYCAQKVLISQKTIGDQVVE